jgi:hypothetical protein
MRAIDWPEGLRAHERHLVAENELFCDAAPERLWAWLVRAPRWHELYRNCRRLKFLDGGGPDLKLGSRISWWTFGLRVVTIIDRFEPNAVLGWSGSGLGTRAHHVWTIDRVGNKTRLFTAEAQRGPASRLLAPVLRRGISSAHQTWLEGFARAAALGAPSDIPSGKLKIPK